ncbi:glycosyltransferase family 4 protein [Geobacter pelophilus]|uniref:Glycosyltransferase family 4 protein n=1 Tax=Geoanaerobacter pelophilus TaxID=60036 RepID=A0AAW4L6X9_9BACT|nr:glycosyltransferase family 4 protein [Geoanaerobacter pelophilus]MBT0663011.1 glycosyltransferase family 4 protein [Geoanaerobacter pelophilus]
MKIAFMGLKTFPPEHGGMETMTSAIVAELIKDPQFSVTVLPLYCSSQQTGTENLKVVPLRVRNIPYLRSILGGFAGAIKVYRIKPDVIHLNGLENAYLLPLLRLVGLKVVLNIRGTKWTLSRWGGSRLRISNLPILAGMLFFKINMKFFSLWANKIVTVNDVSLSQMPPLARQKATVIYNSLDVHLDEDKDVLKRHALSPSGYLMFIGRLVPLKGVHYLIEAYSKINEPNLPLVIVGRFDKNNLYHAYLKQLAGGSDVRFIGAYYSNTAYTLIKHSRLMVLPSETEGMAVTILEAAILGTPILTSDIPENTKLWGDSIFYFQNKQSLELKNQLNTLIKNKLLCQSKVEAAFDIANNKFNHKKQMSKMLSVYRDCV